MEGAGHVGGHGCSRTRSRVLHSGGRPFRTGCGTSTVGQEEEAEWRFDVPCPRTRHRVPNSGGRLFRTGRDTSTAEQEVEWRLGGWGEMEAGLGDGVVKVGEGREGEGNLPSGSDERGKVRQRMVRLAGVTCLRMERTPWWASSSPRASSWVDLWASARTVAMVVFRVV